MRSMLSCTEFEKWNISMFQWNYKLQKENDESDFRECVSIFNCEMKLYGT